MAIETFSIGETAKITGVPERKIRHWERRKYIPEAIRITYGDRKHRRFDHEQVQLIRQIKKYIDAGYTLHMASSKAKITPYGMVK
jgi:DNA-binding transcriptional MerR regulator